jgi:hypothetical protein
MTTSDLIDLLKQHEFGASGRPREISFNVIINEKNYLLGDTKILFTGSGDGCAGSELILNLGFNYCKIKNKHQHLKSYTNLGIRK